MIVALHVIITFGLSRAVYGSQSGSPLKVSTVERDLLSSLLRNYSVYTRPTSSLRNPVLVDFDWKLVKLVKLSIKEQELIANSKITMRWMDPSLIWNKTEYENVDFLNIPNSLIWTPDILLHNTAVLTSQSKADVYKANVRVDSTGYINWMSPVTIRASCSLNIRMFPFDEQTCDLSFGSISYTDKHLVLLFRKQPGQVSEVKAQVYYSSGEWEMHGLTSKVENVTYEGIADSFSMIKYTIKWKRLSGYWILYLVCPCMCLSFISLFTFFIPAEAGERTGFGITTVLAMSVYLLVISEKLPEMSDNAPLIGVLYVVLFLTMVGVLLSSIMTTHLAFKKTKPPAFLRRLLQRKKLKNSNVVAPAMNNEDVGEGRTETPPLKEEMPFQEEWQEISRKIDQKLFWAFVAITILGPSLVIIAYQH